MRWYISLLCLVITPACASEPEPPEPPEDDEFECPESIAPAEAIASTPRDIIHLELLALQLSAGEVADQDIYDRLTADVAALGDIEPAVTSIEYFPPNDGQTLILTVSKATLDAMESGDYTAWNCLNEHYGLLDFQPLRFDSVDLYLAEVKLKGIYNLVLVSQHYDDLPGVYSAGPNARIGDGSTICVTPEDSTWHIVFDRASGDCPAGCLHHHMYYFTTQADGNRMFIDEWDSQLGQPAPEWARRYAFDACR